MKRSALVFTFLLVLPLSQLSPAIAQVPVSPSGPGANPSPLPSGASPSPSGSPSPLTSPTPTPDYEEVGPKDKDERISIFQDRRIIFSPDPKNHTHSLRQGPDTIYDVDFVELMDDPSLTKDWLHERNKDWSLWIGQGVIAVPVGLFLFVQNFQVGSPPGQLALFGTTTRTSDYNVSDPRTFALSLLGVGIAAYGVYNLGLWVAEELDKAHPNRLEDDSIGPRVSVFNDHLQDTLNLDAGDIPPPPSPRPSPSPSPSTSPSPGTIIQPNLPPEPVDQEGPPPPSISTPLPIEEPGVLPSTLVPSPAPVPSDFMFPGNPGRVPASPDGFPGDTSGSPAVKVSPPPSPAGYPGTEP